MMIIINDSKKNDEDLMIECKCYKNVTINKGHLLLTELFDGGNYKMCLWLINFVDKDITFNLSTSKEEAIDYIKKQIILDELNGT